MTDLRQGEHHHSDGSFHSWSGVQAGKKTQLIPPVDPLKGSAKKTTDNDIPDPYANMSTIEKLVDQTTKFSENISAGIAGLNELQTSPLAGVNTSASSADTGGSLFDSTNKHVSMSAPDYQSGVHTGIDPTGAASKTAFDAPDDKQAIKGTGIDTWTPEALSAAGYAQNPDGSVRYVGFPEGDVSAQGEVVEPKTPVVAPSDDVTAKPTLSPMGEIGQTVRTVMESPEFQPVWDETQVALSNINFGQALDAINFDIESGTTTYQDFDFRRRSDVTNIKTEIETLENRLVQELTSIHGKRTGAENIQGIPPMAQAMSLGPEFIREEVRGKIREQLISQGFSESEINIFMYEAGSRPDIFEPVEDVDAVEADLGQGTMTTPEGETIYYHTPEQWQSNRNTLTNLITKTRDITRKGPTGWNELQKAVAKAVELPPNYIVRTDNVSGQVFIEWDYDAERAALESTRLDLIQAPQRLPPDQERRVIAEAQAYYTELNRAQQLLTQHYDSEFDMKIIDKELQAKADELLAASTFQKQQLELEGKKVQITREEFEAIYGPDGIEGKKFDALYGTGVDGEEMGVERLRVKVEEDRLALDQDIRLDKLMLEAGKIVFSPAKARAMGLDVSATGMYETLASQLQNSQLAIQKAEQSGLTRVEILTPAGNPSGTFELIATAKQRNQHVIEAQQYANLQTEQSGRQHLVQNKKDFEATPIQNRLGTAIGAYGEFVVVQTQTSTFAREQFGEAVSARKNQQAIEQDRIEADKEISATMEQLRLTGIATEAATAQSIANTNAESAKAVAQLRLDAEKTGIDNELTLLDRRIELEAQREGQTLSRQEIARQAEITMQIELSKQRIIEEAAQRGTELEERIAERLATLQITKEIGTENSANALAQVTARMEAEQTMQDERLESAERIATEAVTSAEVVALAQAAAKVTLSEAEKTYALDRLTQEIEANATAQGLQLDSIDARAAAELLMRRELAETAGTQATEQITAQTAAEKQRLEDRLATEKSFVEEERAALAIATDPIVVAQARQVASTFVGNLNAALAQGTQGNFEEAASAMAAELPPPPPGIAWDASLGRFSQRPGFEGREMTPATQEWISATTGAYKARDRAEQAIREGTRLRTESQLRESERQSADEDFRQAMLTSEIDTAEEAIARQRIAESRQIENQTKLDNLQMLFGLLANPVQLGFAKKHGLLGQIEAVLGFAISNVPEAAIGPVIPNINEWQTMDSEQQAFSIANFVEQGGSPNDFMAMVQGAAPAQMQQVQYGVL